MKGSGDSSSNNDSKEKKDKQIIKEATSENDLQNKINRFQHDILYKLNNLR